MPAEQHKQALTPSTSTAAASQRLNKPLSGACNLLVPFILEKKLENDSKSVTPAQTANILLVLLHK